MCVSFWFLVIFSHVNQWQSVKWANKYKILILNSHFRLRKLRSSYQGTKNVAIYAFSSGKILDVRQIAGVKDMTNIMSAPPHLQVGWAELRNVNSFTRSKTLELNFTPRKARKSRQFWDLSETKLTKIIVLENKCWQLFQIRLVYTQKSYINCANLFKIGLIWSYCVFSQTCYPNL